MSLTNFTGNTNVVAGLPNEPTLPASQLKAKFDEAETALKTFINGTLEPEIEQLVATEKSNIQGLITALGNQLREELLEDNKRRYHVGRIIFDTENVNPATYLGFGVWQLWGTGKVPVGVDIEDTNFNEVEKTGGEKTHTLTIDEMPAHSHSPNNALWAQSGGYGSVNATGSAGANMANITSQASKNTGGGQAHNNLQPYITCYMWKRVS